MSLCVYIVHDPDASIMTGERDHQLIAAYNPQQAVIIWLSERGLTLDDDQPVVELAKWGWPGVQEPKPTAAGIWWPKEFRGYGLRDLDDYYCSECGEHVPGEDWDTDRKMCESCAYSYEEEP